MLESNTFDEFMAMSFAAATAMSTFNFGFARWLPQLFDALGFDASGSRIVGRVARGGDSKALEHVLPVVAMRSTLIERGHATADAIDEWLASLADASSGSGQRCRGVVGDPILRYQPQPQVDGWLSESGGRSSARFASQRGVGRIDKRAYWTIDGFRISDDVEVRMLGDDAAVLAYTVHEELTVDGASVTVGAADASTWVCRDGRWLCALHSESITGDPFGRDRGRSCRGSCRQRAPFTFE